jgi:hypothetical protein
MRFAVLILLAMVAFSAAAQGAEKRFALVMGNESYPNSPVPGAVGDADAVAAALKGDGFQVQEITNADLKAIERGIDWLVHSVGRGDRSSERHRYVLFTFTCRRATSRERSSNENPHSGCHSLPFPVTFSAVIGVDGHVKQLDLISGDPLLVDAARQAVSQWLYNPTVSNFEPVEIATTITINFALHSKQ